MLKNISPSLLSLFFILCSVSLFVSSIQYVDATPPTSYDADITLSHPPKLGETAQVKLEITDIFNLHTGDDVLDYNAVIHLPEGFELVDGTINKTATWKVGEPFVVDATIKAIKPGNWSIYGYGLGVITGNINTVVSENDAYFHQGHFQTPPNYATMIDPANVTILSRSELLSASPPPPFSADVVEKPSVSIDISKMQPMPPTVSYDYDALLDQMTQQQQQLPSSSSSSPPADVTTSPDSPLLPISGNVQFQDGRNDDETTPAAGTTVCVFDDDDGGLEELSCTITNDDGTWDLGSVDRFEEDGSLQDLVFAFMTTNDSFEVLDKDKKYYTHMTDTLGEFSGPEIFGLVITIPSSPSQTNQAFWIFSTMHEGWKFFNDLGFDHQDDDKVKVLWEQGTDANYSPKINPDISDDKITTHYHPDPEYQEIRLDGRTINGSLGGDLSDPVTILHEYGHHVMNIVYSRSGDNTADAYDPGAFGCFRNHGILQTFTDDDNNPIKDESGKIITECPWIEGWANFVPLAVLRDSNYLVNFQGINVDFETGEFTGFRSDIKWKDEEDSSINSAAIEGRVTMALWDMYDAENDMDDGINDVSDDDNDGFETDFANIWSVFNGMSDPPNKDRPADDFIEFWHDWMRENPETASQTHDILKFNNIGDNEIINEPPDITSNLSITVLPEGSEIIFEATDEEFDVLTFNIPVNERPENGETTAIITSDDSRSAKTTYIPDNDGVTSDQFTIRVFDGIESAFGTVNITVDDTLGEIDVLSDEFIDFTHWDSSGDGDVEKWEIIADDVNGGLNGKIVSSKDCETFCYLTIKDGIKLTGYVDPTISFSWLVSDTVDGSEGLYLQVFDDGSWKEIGSWTENTGDSDGLWHVQFPPISLEDYISPSVELRFVAKSSAGAEKVQIDNVVIRANPEDSGSGDNNDDDKDGISNSLDTEIDSPSDDFSDELIEGGGGSTSGSILKRGGQEFVIVDSDDENKGVNISTNIVDAENNALSEVSLCEDDAILKMNDGDSLAATCGSVILDGTKGKISVELNSDDDVNNNTFTTRLDENDSLKFDPTIPSLTTTDTSGTLKIRIEGSGLVFDLLSGDTLSPPIESPIDVLANSTSHNQIELFWTAPNNDGGAPITGYKIERESLSPEGTEEGFVTIKLHTNSTDTTFTDGGGDTGLLPDTQYNYQVYAINEIGISNSSNIVNATTSTISEQTPPAVPTGVRIVD